MEFEFLYKKRERNWSYVGVGKEISVFLLEPINLVEKLLSDSQKLESPLCNWEIPATWLS